MRQQIFKGKCCLLINLKSIRNLLEGMTKNRPIKPNKRNPGPASSAPSFSNGKTPPARPKVNHHQDGSHGHDSDYDNNDDDDDGDEDLKAIFNFIKHKLPTISSLSADSKRLILKDFKRVKASTNSQVEVAILIFMFYVII